MIEGVEIMTDKTVNDLRPFAASFRRYAETLRGAPSRFDLTVIAENLEAAARFFGEVATAATKKQDARKNSVSNA